MRLLEFGPDGNPVFKTFDLSESTFVVSYAVLSHTWGDDHDEVTYQDILDGTASSKPGFSKLDFCGRQAAREGIQYFWVDTCCIDKSNSTELQEAINSMFRWYQESTRCYVYLSDVKHDFESDGYLERSLRASRWFTRGWTLQELIAPSTVDFFSVEGRWLGDKHKLRQQILEITNIDPEALQGRLLHRFRPEEKWSWASGRRTKREEDAVYCLLGIFGVHMPLIYGEGYANARKRIDEVLDRPSSLARSTRDVQEYSCPHIEHTDVRLVDTPGFDDSDRSDASVLGDVSQWLGEKYKQRILLHGVVYLQRITDIRMQKSSWRSLRALRSVCGNDALKNVYLATTMWERLGTEAEGVRRESLLLEPKCWGEMIKNGCKTYRLENSTQSALALVRRIVDTSRPIALHIQQELVDQDKSLDETDAGRELQSDLIREREKFQAEKDDLLRELEEKRAWREETAKKLDSLEEQLRKKAADIEDLQSTFESAGKELTRERIQEREKYEQEKQALVTEIEMRKLRDNESRSATEDAKDALEELEGDLGRKDVEIASLRMNLVQSAAKTSRQDYDLQQAKKILSEEKERLRSRVSRREDMIKSLKTELEEQRSKLRHEREKSARERRRADDYRDKYHDAKERIERRDQKIDSLQRRVDRHQH